MKIWISKNMLLCTLCFKVSKKCVHNDLCTEKTVKEQKIKYIKIWKCSYTFSHHVSYVGYIIQDFKQHGQLHHHQKVRLFPLNISGLRVKLIEYWHLNLLLPQHTAANWIALAPETQRVTSASRCLKGAKIERQHRCANTSTHILITNVMFGMGLEMSNSHNNLNLNSTLISESFDSKHCTFDVYTSLEYNFIVLWFAQISSPITECECVWALLFYH